MKFLALLRAKHQSNLTTIADAKLWNELLLTEEEQSLPEINDWDVAEDWSDWK